MHALTLGCTDSQAACPVKANPPLPLPLIIIILKINRNINIYYEYIL